MTYTPEDAATALKDLGIGKGDNIFVHTGMKSLGTFMHELGEPSEGLLQVFQSLIGDSGTLIVPTFNFGFCHGLSFDIQNTKAEGMGRFSEFVRTHPNSFRSKHPFQSVSAQGAHAKQITSGVSRTAFSEGGAFSEMIKLETKILFFGVPFVETFVHVAEEQATVDYRFWKTFAGEFIDGDLKQIRSVDFYARRLDIEPEPRIDNVKLFNYFKQKGMLVQKTLGSGHVGIIDAVAMVSDLTKNLVTNNRFALCS